MGTREALVIAAALVGSVEARAQEFESAGYASATTGVQVVQGLGAGTILSQVEVDLRAGNENVFFRLDADYHFAPYWFVKGANEEWALFPPPLPLPPEMALVQIGNKYHLRAGVTNANFGIQGYDEWGNYLPTYTSSWALVNGQNLGIEPGINFDDGTEIFVFGGYDMAWLTPGFGGGVATEQGSFGTWSGFFYLPALSYGALVTANEYYPADALWLTLEVTAGIGEGTPFGGGQLIASILPDATVGGAIRFEKMFVPDDIIVLTEAYVDDMAISAAVRADPLDQLHLTLEGKESFPMGGGNPYFTATFLVAVGIPEPGDDYAVRDVEEEEVPLQ